jgi:hypothetical protein
MIRSFITWNIWCGWRGRLMYTKRYSEKLKPGDYLGDLGVDSRIILK